MDGAAAQEARPAFAAPGVVAVEAYAPPAAGHPSEVVEGRRAPPAFLDRASLARLSQFFAASPGGAGQSADRDTATAHLTAARPSSGASSSTTDAAPSRAFSLGSGLASVLPSLRLPAFDLFDAVPDNAEGTLQQARRDAGEARLLSEEVRSRAEELSRRFAGGLWDDKAATKPAIAVSGEVAGGAPASEAMGDQRPDALTRAVTAISGAFAPLAGNGEPEGRMGLGFTGQKLDAAGEGNPAGTSDGSPGATGAAPTSTQPVSTRKVTTLSVPVASPPAEPSGSKPAVKSRDTGKTGTGRAETGKADNNKAKSEVKSVRAKPEGGNPKSSHRDNAAPKADAKPSKPQGDTTPASASAPPTIAKLLGFGK